MTHPIDYTAVLADLETKRDQLTAAIAGIRAMMGSVDASEGDDGDAASTDKPAEGAAPKAPRGAASAVIQSDTFFGMSTAGAVRKYLTMTKKTQTPKAIANALREGGQIHATSDETAYRNVYSVLTRKEDVDFCKMTSGEWGLAEWYRRGKNAAAAE